MAESRSETESEDEDAREPQPKRQPHGKWRKRIDFKKNLRPDDSDPIPLDHPELEGASEFDMWQKCVPVSLFEEIARQTNLYATRDRNRRNFSVAPGDLARFFSVLLLSGYHCFPRRLTTGRTSLTSARPLYLTPCLGIPSRPSNQSFTLPTTRTFPAATRLRKSSHYMLP